MRTQIKLAQIALGGAALVAALALAPVATAAPIEDRQASVVERHDAATTRAEQQRVIDYWTPERMKSAIPRELVIQPRGKPGTGSGAEAVRVNAQPQHGKVFFSMNGANYVCSGTATQSTNGDVVTTAGHCVNEGPGDYATNFAFVPAYENGARPYGTWAAETLLTTSQWAGGGDFNHDVGFAVMAEQGGQSLTAVTGSFPIAFNLGYGLTFDAYGYPAAGKYNGQYLYRCSGTADRDTLGGSADHRLPCSMTGGSSGGGWITGGKLNSVNSFGYRGEKDVMYGPYFGNTEQSVYSAAASS